MNQLYHEKNDPNDVETSTPAIEWGTQHEEPAKALLKKRHNVQMIDLGLGLHPQYPSIGASPDGLIMTNDHHFWLIEIKCPYGRD